MVRLGDFGLVKTLNAAANVSTPKDDTYSLGLLYCKLVRPLLSAENVEISFKELVKHLVTSNIYCYLAHLLHKATKPKTEDRPTVKEAQIMNLFLIEHIKFAELTFNRKFNQFPKIKSLKEFVDSFLYRIFDCQNSHLFEHYKKLWYSKYDETDWPNPEKIQEEIAEIFSE